MGDIIVVFVAVVGFTIVGGGGVIGFRRWNGQRQQVKAYAALEAAHQRRLKADRDRHAQDIQDWDDHTGLE